MAIAGDVGINRLITRPWGTDEADLVFYVRAGGNDNNSGLSPAAAFLTFERALRERALYSTNRTIGIDIGTGMTFDSETLLQLGGTWLGHIRQDYDLNELAPNYFGWKTNTVIRSEPDIEMTLTVTGQAADADTGLITLTVSNALTPNQLRDMFAVGSDFGDYGAIVSHTSGAGPNTIVTSCITPFVLPVVVAQPGATLRYGDPANFFDQAIYLNALSDVSFLWIRFESNGPKDTAIVVWPNAPVNFFGCVMEGFQAQGDGAVITIDCCVIRNQVFAQDGAALRTLASTFRGVTFICHGSGASGLNEMVATHIVNCSGAYGGGNVESRFNFALDNCDVSGSSTDGIEARFGTSSIVNCDVHNNAAAGVRVSNGATANLNNVTGTGNGTHGCAIRNMGQVIATGGTDVTGTSGNVQLGAAGTVAWGAAPVTDAVELARLG